MNWGSTPQNVLLRDMKFKELFLENQNTFLSLPALKTLLKECKSVDDVSKICNLKFSEEAINYFIETETRITLFEKVIKNNNLTQVQVRKIFTKFSSKKSKILYFMLNSKFKFNEFLVIEDFNDEPDLTWFLEWVRDVSAKTLSNEELVNFLDDEKWIPSYKNYYSVMLTLKNELQKRKGLTELILETNNSFLKSSLVYAVETENVNFEEVLFFIKENEEKFGFSYKYWSDAAMNMFIDPTVLKTFFESVSYQKFSSSQGDMQTLISLCEYREVKNIFVKHDVILTTDFISKLNSYYSYEQFSLWFLRQPNFKNTLLAENFVKDHIEYERFISLNDKPFWDELLTNFNVASFDEDYDEYIHLAREIAKQQARVFTPEEIFETFTFSRLNDTIIKIMESYFLHETKDFTEANWEIFFTLIQSSNVTCKDLAEVASTI